MGVQCLIALWKHREVSVHEIKTLWRQIILAETSLHRSITITVDGLRERTNLVCQNIAPVLSRSAKAAPEKNLSPVEAATYSSFEALPHLCFHPGTLSTLAEPPPASRSENQCKAYGVQKFQMEKTLLWTDSLCIREHISISWIADTPLRLNRCHKRCRDWIFPAYKTFYADTSLAKLISIQNGPINALLRHQPSARCRI